MIKANRVGRGGIATTQLSVVTMAPYRYRTRGRYSVKRRYRPRRKTYARTRFSKRRFGMRRNRYRRRTNYRHKANYQVLKIVHRWTGDGQFSTGVHSDCLSFNANDINSLPAWDKLNIIYDEWKPGKKYMKQYIPFEKYGNDVDANSANIIRWSAYDPDARARKFLLSGAVADMKLMQGSKWKMVRPRQVISTSFQPKFSSGRDKVNLTGIKAVDNPWRDCVVTVPAEACTNGVQVVWTCNTGTTLTIKTQYTQVYYFRGLRDGNPVWR
uniref:Coat protein n=1 Tax=Dragonfly larvae associated circular virus-10 TaxID=1454022 RepID=A0A140AQS2_9VIRU|nr:coat protein [Dragonfly larvae associated circular virus-10]